MRTKGFWMVVPVLSITLGAGGCLVTASTYEAKTREADSLREALASANKEKTIAEDRFSTIEKQLAEEKEANAALASRNRELTEALQKTKEELDSVVRNYEGTRITREELISELLEKEKATGKRIQELTEIAQACEMERDQQAAETRDTETLRRERDILLGRIERMKEERTQEARRRDLRFAQLVATFADLSSSIGAAPAGPLIRILVPDKVFYRKGTSTLTDTGKKVIGELGKAASEFPSATLFIAAGGKSRNDEIRAMMIKGHALPQERVRAQSGNRPGETELLLVIP